MTSGSFSSDRFDHDGVPSWVVESLQAPVTSRAEARTRIMQQVRGVPAPRRLSIPLVQRASRWRRRGSLTGLGGALLTAMLVLAVSVQRGDQQATAMRLQPTAMVLGDSAVPVRGADSLAAVLSGRWLDTLKVVEYVVRGSDVRRVIVQRAVRSTGAVRSQAAVSMASRDQRIVPFQPAQLTRVSAHEWRVRALLPRDAIAVSFTVNDVTLDPVPVRDVSTSF